MNPDPPPITAAETAGIIQRALNAHLRCAIADPPREAAFELTAPATGQRFRVTVTEVPGRTSLPGTPPREQGGRQCGVT